jgi:predicted DNA-binding protein
MTTSESAPKHDKSKSPRLYYSGELWGPLANRLIEISKREGREPADLVGEAIEKIIEDDLFTALDLGEDAA